MPSITLPEEHRVEHASSPVALRTRREGLSSEARILRTSDDMERVRADWMRLGSSAESNWDLYWSLIRNRKPHAEPYVAALFEEDVLHAAFVGRIENSQIRLKLGYWRPLRLSVRRIVFPMQSLIGQADEARLQTMLERVVQDLRDRKADLAVFDYLEVGSVPHRAATGLRLGILMRDLVLTRQIHRYVRLPATFKEYARQHRRLLEKARKFEKAFDGRYKHRLLCGEGDIDVFCEGANAVMRKTYQRALGVGFSINTENVEKMRAAARQGAWRAFATFIDERMVAFWCGCSFSGMWVCWWTAYDPDYQPYSPGLVSSTRMAEQFISEGITTIDFGGGDATHKERLSNEARWEESVCIYAPSFRGFMANCVHGLDSAIGNLFRNRLKHFANRLRTPWRRLLARNVSRQENRAQEFVSADTRPCARR